MPSDAPEDAIVSKSFRHRLNPDRTHYSVCMLCYQRVGTCEDEADLAAAEFFHGFSGASVVTAKPRCCQKTSGHPHELPI